MKVSFVLWLRTNFIDLKEKDDTNRLLRAFVYFNYRGPNRSVFLTCTIGSGSDAQSSCTQLSDLIPTKSC